MKPLDYNSPAETSRVLFRLPLLLSLFLCLFGSMSISAEPLRIMASIKPLALMVEAVAGEHATVNILVKPGQTPHDFAFKVSDRQKLSQADLLVWVGADLEPYLSALAGGQPSLSMAHVLDARLPADDSQESEEGHDRGHHHGSDNDLDSSEAHKHSSHAHGDQHFWLNPDYGVAMIRALAEQLTALDPVHQQDYQRNAEQVIKQLDALLATSMKSPVQQPRQYAVVHRAYDHFLMYFQYPEPLVLTPVPEISPGARQLWRVSQQLQHGDCLLVDSSAPARWVDTFSRRNQLSLKQVDIMGYGDGVGTYLSLLGGVIRVFDECARAK